MGASVLGDKIVLVPVVAGQASICQPRCLCSGLRNKSLLRPTVGSPGNCIPYGRPSAVTFRENL